MKNADFYIGFVSILGMFHQYNEVYLQKWT